MVRIGFDSICNFNALICAPNGAVTMPAALKKHERYWNEVAIYGDYKPYGAHKEQGGDSTNWPAHCGLILDLKAGNAAAIQHFAAMIAPELSDGVVIVTIPSHDPASAGDGLKKLAVSLAQNGNRVDG